MEIKQILLTDAWDERFSAEIQAQVIAAIEAGQLLFFPNLAFQLTTDERQFLSPTIVDPKVKNISFNLHTDELRGATIDAVDDLKQMLKRFSTQARQLIEVLFPRYMPQLIQGRTSFRPVGVEGRVTSYRKDDRRLHVDAFPATPNQGKRILRVFSNVNPHGEDRVWRIGEPFTKVVERFVPKICKPMPGSAAILKWLGITKSYRTLYDHFMLQIHDRMKGDEAYQQQVQWTELRLPPASTWVVQTDHVSHAAMSGQYLLEQTFYLPVHAMENPDRSPLKILEKNLGCPLI